jgi:excisionase family DNA binding protein
MTPIFVSTEQAAEMLSISVVTMRRLTRAGKIRCTRFGRRTLYTPADLQKFADELQEQPLESTQP